MSANNHSFETLNIHLIHTVFICDEREYPTVYRHRYYSDFDHNWTDISWTSDLSGKCFVVGAKEKQQSIDDDD